jgi:hypothetical protein
MSTAQCPCLNISGIPQKENGTNGKWQFPFVFCKRKMERLLATKGNGKQAFVFLGQQTINGN